MNALFEDDKMAESRMGSKRKIKIPRNIREHLKLKLGDKLIFRVTGNEQVVVDVARYHISELYGLLRRKGEKPVSVEAMDQAICIQIESRDERTRKWFFQNTTVADSVDCTPYNRVESRS